MNLNDFTDTFCSWGFYNENCAIQLWKVPIMKRDYVIGGFGNEEQCISTIII